MLEIIILGIIILLALAFLSKNKRPPSLGTLPYKMKDTLYSPAERSFLGVLDQAIGNDYRIFGHVRIADFIKVKKGLSNSERTTAQNKINSKHVDFLLCSKDDLSVKAAIELDDKSHNKKQRVNRDEFLKNVCIAADLPVIRFTAQATYNITEVKKDIYQSLKIPEKTENISPYQTPTRETKAALPTNNVAPDTSKKDCPKCLSPMMIRKAMKGKNAGKLFWGCTNYPKCKTIIPVNT